MFYIFFIISAIIYIYFIHLRLNKRIYRKWDKSNETIKATFKVAFSHSYEEDNVVVAEYKEEKSISRKLLLKNYSDIDKSSEIQRIIEKLKSRHE